MTLRHLPINYEYWNSYFSDPDIDSQCLGNIIYLATLAHNIHHIGLSFKGAVTNYTRIVLTTEVYSETPPDKLDSQEVDDHINRDLAKRALRKLKPIQ